MQKLYTEEGRSLPAVPWDVYPRPQLVRRDWLCLNGDWQLGEGTIRVPFCAESLLSGVPEPPAPGTPLCCSRRFSVPEAWAGKHVLLHFGAVSREAEVFLNGDLLCRHENAYLPFSADVTAFLREGENLLELRVINDLNPAFPYGKQTKKRGGMWYTPCSGIWQTVWLEPVPERYIRSVRLDTGRDWAEVRVEGMSEGILSMDGQEWPVRDGSVRVEPAEVHAWSPEDPYLYHFRLRMGEDEVESYFALRTLGVEERGGIPRLCLNGEPYFFHAVLDQGYWSDGLWTPADPGAFERDILAMKSLGFNTLRKHIKVEPERFYYDCDRLGMIVFQDMVNNGVYRYVRDTVLPTLHMKYRRDRRLNPDPETRKNFLEAMIGTVELLRNHPCICLWTVFNEGWGQFCADDAYRRLRQLDSSRLIDTTSGWYRQKESDVESIHNYFEKLRLGRQHRPQFLSEFGGYVLKIPEHSFNLEKTYGYRTYQEKEDYTAALRAAWEELVTLAEAGLCGAVYTQLSDVEDETNGFLTYDRAVLKADPAPLAAFAERLQEAVRGGKRTEESGKVRTDSAK